VVCEHARLTHWPRINRRAREFACLSGKALACRDTLLMMPHSGPALSVQG
jgi:hypothetical protein